MMLMPSCGHAMAQQDSNTRGSPEWRCQRMAFLTLPTQQYLSIDTRIVTHLNLTHRESTSMSCRAARASVQCTILKLQRLRWCQSHCQPLQPGCVFIIRQAPSGAKLWTGLEAPLTHRRPTLELPEPPCSPGLHEDSDGVPGDACSCWPRRALHAVPGGSQQSA